MRLVDASAWVACHDDAMARLPADGPRAGVTAASSPRRALSPGVEYEFQRLTVSRDFSRSVVTRMLVERAEHGGWELARVRIGSDGVRRITLRRKIIRQTRPPYLLL